MEGKCEPVLLHVGLLEGRKLLNIAAVNEKILAKQGVEGANWS